MSANELKASKWLTAFKGQTKRNVGEDTAVRRDKTTSSKSSAVTSGTCAKLLNESAVKVDKLCVEQFARVKAATERMEKAGLRKDVVTVACKQNKREVEAERVMSVLKTNPRPEFPLPGTSLTNSDKLFNGVGKDNQNPVNREVLQAKAKRVAEKKKSLNVKPQFANRVKRLRKQEPRGEGSERLFTLNEVMSFAGFSSPQLCKSLVKVVKELIPPTPVRQAYLLDNVRLPYAFECFRKKNYTKDSSLYLKFRDWVSKEADPKDKPKLLKKLKYLQKSFRNSKM